MAQKRIPKPSLPQLFIFVGWLLPGISIAASLMTVNSMGLPPRKAIFIFLALPFVFLAVGGLFNALIRRKHPSTPPKPPLLEARRYLLLQLAFIPAVLLIFATFLFALGVVKY